MEISYSEKQRFTQWWLWLILIGVLLIPFFGIYQQLIVGQPFGNNPMSDTGLLIFAALMVVFLSFFYLMRLTLTIDPQGLFVHFFPLFRRKVTWDKIEQLEIVNYGFVGGYGIRITKRFGTVYNMSGKWGLLVHLKGGDKFCIGTKRKEELQAIINDLEQKQF